MHTLRTRFKRDIVCEFLPPNRPSKQQKVIILAGGMPGYPKAAIVPYLAKKGFWVFQPRYRGSWESGGRFLEISPEQDILDCIDGLPRGFIDFWHNKIYKIKPDKLYIIGSSFGGPAALLLSGDPRITKIVAISSVIDWQDKSDEPMDWLEGFTRKAFGHGYRFTNKDWRRLVQGKFYNPIKDMQRIDGGKTLFIHTKDDTIVRYGPVKKFVDRINAKLVTIPRGGHTGMSILLKPYIWKQVSKFIK